MSDEGKHFERHTCNFGNTDALIKLASSLRQDPVIVFTASEMLANDKSSADDTGTTEA